MLRSICSLLFIFSLAPALAHPYLLPEQLYYDVKFYGLNLRVDPAGQFIEGEATVAGEIVHNGTAQILLNLYDNMSVDSVTAQGQSLAFTHAGNVLSVDLPFPLNAGEPFLLAIRYSGYPVTAPPFSSGLNFTSYLGQPLVTSYSWPYFANTFFPCKDHPSDKADSARIAVSVPDNFKVAGNGTLSAVNPLPGNQAEYVWESHYPLTPYHISINIYPFDRIQSEYNSPLSGPIPLEYYLFPNHTAAAQAQLESVVPQIHEAFEARYGAFPFPGDKYGIVEALISGGMEHQTILTMNYPSFFSDIVVHESAHEYFGNMISISDWAHVWLSEGFATYSEVIFLEYWNGAAAYQAEINAHMAGAGSGAIYVSDPSNPANIIPYSLVYLKASTVLHMLRFVMGDGAFFSMLHDYVTVSPYRYKNIDTEQFRAFCENYYGGDLDWFFEQWIYRDGKMAGEYYHYWNESADSLVFRVRSVPSDPISRTYHAMPTPIRFSAGGTQFSDTLWVDSLTLVRTYAFADTAILALQIDPDNKLLKGSFTYLDHPRLESAFLQQNAIHLSWRPFFDYTEYRVYVWKKESGGNYLFVDSTSVAGTGHAFTPAANGTYRAGVAGLQNGRKTAISNFLEVNYTTFPLDQGILIVDETRNGDGGNMLSPTDEAVDAFYDTLLAGMPYQQLDVISENRPPEVFDLAPYSLLLWHHDVTHPTRLAAAESALRPYLEAGGKIIFSGMSFLQNLSPGFAEQFLGYSQQLTIGADDFTGAAGSFGFSDLALDTSKITLPNYNRKLRNVTVFDTSAAARTVFRYISESGNPAYHLKTCGALAPAVSDPTRYAALTLGLPLYFIETDTARAFVLRALEALDISLGIETPAVSAPRHFVLLNCYPNPFNPSTVISYQLSAFNEVELTVYNVLGQRVRSLYSGKLPAGMHKLEWNGRNDAGERLGSGIFFVNLRAAGRQQTVKAVLLR